MFQKKEYCRFEVSPDHKQLSNQCFPFVECAKVDLTLRRMEAVDRSSDLHLEEIEFGSLSEPVGTETSGENTAEAGAESSGGILADASAESSGVIPAEDRHTPSSTSQTKATKRTPPWKVVYYGSGLLIVVAVWILALLPPVLTFSIVRSPVQVIYEYGPELYLHHN